MSWLVENYIINQEQIKSSADINSDEYMDVLIIEKLINKLHRKNVITDREMKILNFISDGYTLDDISREMSLSRITVSAWFTLICQKIAFILGGYYTDDGFLEYIKEKYKFDIETMERISRFIHSNKKHRTKRTKFLYNKDRKE